MTDFSSLYEELHKNSRHAQLLEARTIILSQGVNAALAERIVGDLWLLSKKSDDPIKLIVNSPGGEVNSGFAIFDTIRFIAPEVHVLNAGLCASIATIINCAVPSKQRFSLPHTKFLIHQPLIMGHIEGSASDLEIHAEDILKTREKLNQILAESCSQDLKKVTQDTQRDYWMSAEEAKKYGLISQIISSSQDFPET